jgi:hypothetical protein
VTFANPWIDPRILQVRPEAARAYRLAHRSEYLGLGTPPDLLMFASPRPRGEKPNVLQPTSLGQGYQI